MKQTQCRVYYEFTARMLYWAACLAPRLLRAHAVPPKFLRVGNSK